MPTYPDDELYPGDEYPAGVTYDVQLGPLKFTTVLEDLTEVLGDGLEAVGASLTPGEARPRPFKLTLPVRGAYDSADDYEDAQRIRRQARQLLDNREWRLQGLFFSFGPDPELQCWLIVGGGDISYGPGKGIVTGDWILELTDCYVVGRPGTHAPARRYTVADRRGGEVPRDTRRTQYGTDFESQALPSYGAALPGDIHSPVGSYGAPLSTPGTTVAGRVLWRDVAVVAGDVVRYEPGTPLYAPEKFTFEQLDEPGAVRVWDIPYGYPEITSYEGDVNPGIYGWEQLLGPRVLAHSVERSTYALAVDNGVVRCVFRDDVLTLEQWNGATYEVVARAVGQLNAPNDTLATWSTVSVTAERAVISRRQGIYELRVILQRGWRGPRLEAYAIDEPYTGIVFQPSGAFTVDTADPTWVYELAVTGEPDHRVLVAPHQVDALTDTVTDYAGLAGDAWYIRCADDMSAPIVCLAAQVTLGAGVDASHVASLSIADTRSVPTIVER